MPFSEQTFENVFGLGWHPKGEEIKQLMTFREHAGTPVNVLVPAFVGQEVYDTAGLAFYKATGLTAASWQRITGTDQ